MVSQLSSSTCQRKATTFKEWGVIVPILEGREYLHKLFEIILHLRLTLFSPTFIYSVSVHRIIYLF